MLTNVFFDFVDFSGFKVNHVEWVTPLNNESIEHYAKRLLTQIKGDKPILIGVSFGGIMAIEIGKLIDTAKVILISSAQTKSDIPIYFRRSGFSWLGKLIPSGLFKKTNPLTFWYFGTETKSERDLLRNIINDTDEKFLKWAMGRIAGWKNETVLMNTIKIHGTNDRILPLTKADFEIMNGGHLMIVNRGEEISNLLKRILQ